VLVNAEGRRFGDETTGYSEYAREVLRQPGGVAWVVVDGRIDTLCRPFGDYADLVSTGAVAWCDDVADAAARIGCSPASLEHTLADARASAAGGHDALGRTFWEQPLEPPYGLIKVTGALFHTQGGVLTDDNGAVLKDGERIPGLFAAGGAAAGISGHGPDGYMAGNGLLAALGLGYLAGRVVATVAERT
jgi:fumarate reductase flavoprotein subunit